MAKNHLKRIAASPLVTIKRKGITFMTRPNPGAHSIKEGLPLAVVIRDMLGKAKIMKEVKAIIHDNKVLVDGKRRHDQAHIIGLMDVVGFEEIKEYYRLLFDAKGVFYLAPVDEKEKNLKICKITRKNMSNNSINLHTNDGRTFIVKEKSYNVGDSLLIDLPDQKIKQHIKFEAGNTVYIVKGKSIGKIGLLKEIKGNRIDFEADKKMYESMKDYAMVVGAKESVIKIR